MKDWFYEQMAMYTAYHRNPKNCATHYVGVPVIVFALLIAMSFVSFGTAGSVPITLATVFLAVLLVVYVIAIPLMGMVAAIVHLPLLWLAHMIAGGEPVAAWSIAVGCFVVGWVIQFVGHIFEGRRPALFDNLLQVLAPGFLVTEALFRIGALQTLKDDLQGRSRKFDAVPAAES